MITDLDTKATAYLSLRAALGVRTNKALLRDFVHYVISRTDGQTIRAQIALDWACSDPARRGISTQVVRLTLVRGFLAYLKASIPETEIPDFSLIAKPRRPTPFIFTASEIAKLLDAAAQLNPRLSIDSQTLRTLLGLMACSGMRPGEIINLKTSDVYVDRPPRLLVRGAKFQKSRWVPMHTSTARQLGNYLDWRRTQEGAQLLGALFVSKKIQELKYKTLDRTFQHVIKEIGVIPRQGQLRPTLHSLRHTFAVHRLKQWYAEQADVRALAPHLSVYLGHVNPAESYWYLSAVPELMESAASLFENFGVEEATQ